MRRQGGADVHTGTAARMTAVRIAAVGMTAAGCAATTVTPGEPGSPPSPVTAAPQLPPRPAELRVDEVDPRTLLNPQQQQELGIDSPPRPGTGSSRGEPACHYDHEQPEPFYGYLMAVLPGLP